MTCQIGLVGQCVGLGAILAFFACGESQPPADAKVDGHEGDAYVENPDSMIAQDATDDGQRTDARSDADTTEPDAGTDATMLPSCPVFSDRVMVGERKLQENNESSGLMVSRKNDGVLWTHDDSGDSSRAFALTAEGKNLGIYDIGNATFRDWEDMGLMQVNGTWLLVMGDIGGNQGRSRVQVYLVPEPDVDASASAQNGMLTASVQLDLDYPDGEHNAEGLFVDPIDNAIYIVTKKASGYTQLFRKGAPHTTGLSVLEEAAVIDFSAGVLRTSDETASRVATAADIAVSGDEILIKTYQSSFLWRRPRGASVAEAMATMPCPVPNGPGETIAFSPNANAYFTTTEPAGAAIFRFDRQ